MIAELLKELQGPVIVGGGLAVVTSPVMGVADVAEDDRGAELVLQGLLDLERATRILQRALVAGRFW